MTSLLVWLSVQVGKVFGPWPLEALRDPAPQHSACCAGGVPTGNVRICENDRLPFGGRRAAVSNLPYADTAVHACGLVSAARVPAVCCAGTAAVAGVLHGAMQLSLLESVRLSRVHCFS